MASNNVKSRLALRWSIDQLAIGGYLRMWTFTLPVCLSVPDACKRWSVLLHELVKQVYFSGVRVFELHEFHGLHVHCVVNTFYPVNRLRAIARDCGWGRIHVQRCDREPYYVAKYVGKSKRDGAFCGRRLWAAFGPLGKALTKCKDVVGVSAKGRAFQSIERKDWLIKQRALGGRLRGDAWARYLKEAFRAYHFWIRNEGSAARGFSHAPPEPWSNLTLSL